MFSPLLIAILSTLRVLTFDVLWGRGEKKKCGLYAEVVKEELSDRRQGQCGAERVRQLTLNATTSDRKHWNIEKYLIRRQYRLSFENYDNNAHVYKGNMLNLFSVRINIEHLLSFNFIIYYLTKHALTLLPDAHFCLLQTILNTKAPLQLYWNEPLF